MAQTTNVLGMGEAGRAFADRMSGSGSGGDGGDSMDRRVTRLEEQMVNVDRALGRIESKLDKIDGDLGTVKQDMSYLKGRVDEVSSKMVTSGGVWGVAATVLLGGVTIFGLAIAVFSALQPAAGS